MWRPGGVVGVAAGTGHCIGVHSKGVPEAPAGSSSGAAQWRVVTSRSRHEQVGRCRRALRRLGVSDPVIIAPLRPNNSTNTTNAQASTHNRAVDRHDPTDKHRDQDTGISPSFVWPVHGHPQRRPRRRTTARWHTLSEQSVSPCWVTRQSQGRTGRSQPRSQLGSGSRRCKCHGKRLNLSHTKACTDCNWLRSVRTGPTDHGVYLRKRSNTDAMHRIESDILARCPARRGKPRHKVMAAHQRLLVLAIAVACK